MELEEQLQQRIEKRSLKERFYMRTLKLLNRLEIRLLCKIKAIHDKKITREEKLQVIRERWQKTAGTPA